MTDKVCAEANMTTWWPYARLAAAALALAAIIAQLARSIENALQTTTEWGQHLPTVAANFLSFFTILSNLLAAIVLIVAAVWALRHRHDSRPEPNWLAVSLACASTYMIVTGIVYNTLLRGVEVSEGATLGWSNEIVHVVGPLLIVLDWLFAPGRRRLEWKRIGVVVIFPIVWAAYTMIRGPFVNDPTQAVLNPDYTGGWYPYPFLNPVTAPLGYVSVAFYVVLIAAVIGGVGALIIWVSRRGERWPLPARKA
jgi:hypothetical protein